MQDKIQKDLQSAQLEKDTLKVETLRMLLSEINYARIQNGKELDDAGILVVVQKEIKKRKEAAAGFRSGGREESAQKEEKEAEVLLNYLPAQLSNEELGQIIDEVIKELGAIQISDMGKVIGMVMGKVGGKADGGRVSALVKEKLSK